MCLFILGPPRAQGKMAALRRRDGRQRGQQGTDDDDASMASEVLEKMARVTGLEPATSGVTGRHSNRLSYTRAWDAHVVACCVVGGWIRGSTGSVKRRISLAWVIDALCRKMGV
jgi:hypothetical protein